MIRPGRRLAAESGVFDAAGFFRSGRRPPLGQVLAEIHSLAEVADGPPRWFLCEQEKLSRLVRWRDDYFQYWAEVLAFGEAGGGLVAPAAWVIVVFDAQGEPACCVEYRPVVDSDGALADVDYAEAAWRIA